jgi:NADPH:quinone reductase-like Zn-dependent oxidoreductase
MPEHMRAVVQQAFGGPEVLEVAEVDQPVPLATEVLVRVKAVGVNPVEPLIRSGQFPLIGQPPFILGWDVSGVVEGLEGVTRFAVDDEVYGMPFFPARPAPTRNTWRHRPVSSPASHPACRTPRPPRCRWRASPPGRPWSTPPGSRPGSGY